MLRFIEVICLLKHVSLISKPVLFTLAPKFSVINLLNSWVVRKLELSEILFSTLLMFVLRTVVVNKLLIVLYILFTTSLIFVFKSVVFTKPLVSGILLLTSLIFF